MEVRGARHVPILTTGHEKSRITVCLAAMADGRKLQPLVFKGKRMPQELKKVTGVHIALTHNGWMQVNTTVENGSVGCGVNVPSHSAIVSLFGTVIGVI